MSGGLNAKKAEIQQAAFEAWNVDKFGSVLIHTGVGKTFVFFKSLLETDCKQVIMLAEVSIREKNIRQDSLEYLKYYGVNPLKGRKVVFMCYQSALKTDVRSIFPKGQVFVFADEVDEMASKTRWNFVTNSNWKDVYFLGVTATLDSESIFEYSFGEDTKYNVINNFAPIKYEYHIDDARIDGTTRELQVYIYKHKLDNTKKNIQATKTWIDTEVKVNTWLNDKFRTTMFMREGPAKQGMFQFLMRRRSEFLYNLPSKIEECKKLLAVLPGRTLVFANSTKSLVELGIPAIVSENPNYLKDLEDFQSGKINQAGSNKILLKGSNIKDLDNVIVLSYYSKSGYLKQKAGRMRNTESNIGKLIVFVSESTQEEKWFTSMIEPVSGFTTYNINNILDCL